MKNYDNLFWGMQFRTCKNFWEQQTASLVLSQKFLQIQKPHRHYFDCDCANANRIQIKHKIAILRYCHDSPSLAEGVKGWVFHHCEGESTNRRNQSAPFPSLRGDLSPKQSTKKEWIATTCFRKSRNDESIANCHESLRDSRNDNERGKTINFNTKEHKC